MKRDERRRRLYAAIIGRQSSLIMQIGRWPILLFKQDFMRVSGAMTVGVILCTNSFVVSPKELLFLKILPLPLLCPTALDLTSSAITLSVIILQH